MLRLMHTCYHISPKYPEVTPERTAKYYELELYTSGAGFSVINGKKYPHGKGNILVSLPGDKRYSIGEFECHSFKFLPNGDNEFAALFKTLHGVQNLPCSDELIPLFREIYAFSVKSGCEIHLDAAMRQVVSLICKNQVPDDISEYHFDEGIGKALVYIEENLEKKLTLKCIAGIACMSPSYFHKRFKGCFSGLSPNEYLLKKRIEYAKGLLCDNSLSVESISAMSGFSTRAYFDVCFKKETGFTPAFYRQQLNMGMF